MIASTGAPLDWLQEESACAALERWVDGTEGV
jgi:hypothetical protein